LLAGNTSVTSELKLQVDMHHAAKLTAFPMILLIRLAFPLAGSAAEPETKPLVIAHRGASGYLPEHTLPSIALAHSLGADFIEQDIVLTKDDQPLVIHDLVLDNVTNVREVFPDRHRSDGHFYVADFTLTEIRTLRVHERVEPRTGRLVHPQRYPLGDVHFSLATLAEHIELIQGLNHTTGRDVGLLVELKDPGNHRAQGHDMSRIVLETLAKYGYKDRDDNAIVQTFDYDELHRIRAELGTDLRLFQLLNDRTLKLPKDADDAHLSAALEKLAGYADGVGPSIEMLLSKSRIPGDPKLTNFVEIARDAGLTVVVYTFRADALPRQFTSFENLVDTFEDAGIEGFITDFPDKLATELSAGVLQR
jgi:glycerophosphoryl diester phosphodiesterase